MRAIQLFFFYERKLSEWIPIAVIWLCGTENNVCGLDFCQFLTSFDCKMIQWIRTMKFYCFEINVDVPCVSSQWCFYVQNPILMSNFMKWAHLFNQVFCPHLFGGNNLHFKSWILNICKYFQSNWTPKAKMKLCQLDSNRISSSKVLIS